MKSLTILLIIITLCAKAQTTTINDWKTYPLPPIDSLDSYSSDKNNWIVFKKNSEIFVAEDRVFRDTLPLAIDTVLKTCIPFLNRRRITVFKVDDGYVIGNYRGEFGGGLYWFSSTTKNCYEISHHKIVQLIERNNNLYAIEGLAHMGMSIGSILILSKQNNKWTEKQYLKLPGAPLGVDMDEKGNFVIVTSEGLVSVDKNGKLSTLIKQGIWDVEDYLYPTSLVIKDNIVFVGMRKGVFKYNLKTKKQEWLMPN